MDPKLKAEFAKEVQQLYFKIIEKKTSYKNEYKAEGFGAHNLLCYLAYKKLVSKSLLNSLKQHGLHLLSNNENVLKSLENTIQNLDGWIPSNHVIETSMNDSLKLRNARARNLLGKKPAMMVTIDSKILESPNTLEQLLRNGMNIARINCAYDNTAIWARIIEKIRFTENKLRIQGKYQETCKIYMDLAGPKLRVGKIKRIDYPLKIKVKKNKFGEPMEEKEGLISFNAVKTELIKLDENLFSFVIAIESFKELYKLKEGDFLYFKDSRGKNRKFFIKKVNQDCLLVAIDKTAYITNNTLLFNEKTSMKITGVVSAPMEIYVKKDDHFLIDFNHEKEGVPASLGSLASISITMPSALENVKVGDDVFINDGKIHANITKVNQDHIECKVLSPRQPHKIKEDKGVNLPDSHVHLTVDSLTQKDQEDLLFISRHADMVGASFVNRPEDLKKLKRLLENLGASEMPVIAKIETKYAIKYIGQILLEGLKFKKFGVMVARGDLAIEIGYENLAFVQEEILALCKAAHVPVILATQVMETLARKGIPSRSELADLSFGKEFDCIMLNKGPYIPETISFISNVMENFSKEFIREHEDLCEQLGFE